MAGNEAPIGVVTQAGAPVPRVVKARGDPRTTKRRWIRWTVAQKSAFLDHLAATCNVSDSARAIAVDLPSVYYLRRADAAFAADWAEALRLGYEMLETRLVGHALAGGGDVIEGPTLIVPRDDTDEVILRRLRQVAARLPARPVCQEPARPVCQEPARPVCQEPARPVCLERTP